MKKLIIIAIMLMPIFAIAQERIYYLKAADKQEYQKYEAWCNDSITVTTVQWGKATVKNTNTPGLDYELLKSMMSLTNDTLDNLQILQLYPEQFGLLLKDKFGISHGNLD